jgi:hypothetical protein
MEASSRGAKGENMRARMRFVTTGAVVAFAAAMVLSGSGPASATNNQPILAANGNSETFGTTVYNTGTSDPCGTDPTFVGLKGCGSTGLVGNGFIGVFGSGTGTGVKADSAGTGVYSYGGNVGVEGTTITGTGVKGSNAGSTGVGVLGQVYGTGAGMYGVAIQNGVGVFGDTTDGVGVQARSTNGLALNVLGKVKFSRSGVASVVPGQKSITVTLAGVTTSDLILATVQGGAGAYFVKSAVSGTGKFTIYINKLAGATVVIAYFVMSGP